MRPRAVHFNELNGQPLHIYLDGNFPNEKLHPYDDYKNMSTLNTYCGILSTCHNYKRNIIVD
jgi:hypothetical protein